jgi:hypothetical protein
VSKFPSPENLTREQSEAVEKAAYLLLSAQKEAKAMLARAGIPDDGFGFGSPCNAHIEGHGNCPCSDYSGDGGPCLTRITLDPIATPVPHRSCGHPASKHLST